MKVSLNWVKEYTGIDLSVDELVQKIGRQIGAVEEVVDLGKKYQEIVIAKVISCEKHPNADKLKVCLIDDGGEVKEVNRDKEGLVQVVCAAPNVQAGQLVAWLPPGRTVPSTYNKDPFVLEARELRGIVSNGMLASSQELDIGDDHSGIVVLEKGRPGADFAKEYGLDDYIIDIENKMFTHRPDCFGILGVSREIAGISGRKFTSPDWYAGVPEFASAEGLPVSVKNELPDLVPRFTAVAMSDVLVKSSPLDMQITLMKVGIKPINNVVDTTNFLMHLTGQPMHAYDYDKVTERSGKDAALVIRHPKKGEKLNLLNGKTLEPRPEAIMIATDKELIGVGGVMGGADTEVSEKTRNIILECANFDMYSVRRTSMEHGLFTDAVTRFNKGQSPLQCVRVLQQAVKIIKSVAEAKQASNLVDVVDCDKINIADDGWADKEVEINESFINSRLGLNLTLPDIKQLLQNVEFEFKGENSLKVLSPFWRTDINIPEDIVEEVGRLYDYGRLPKTLPKRAIKPVALDKNLRFKSELRKNLARLGANEVLTYSFVHGNLLQKTSQNKDLAFRITNALSPDLQYYRLSLTPSLLAHVHPNIKGGYDRFAIFEIGKAHNKMHKDDDKGVPKEYEIVALTYADKKAKPGQAYYVARNYLDEVAAGLGIAIEYLPIDKEADVPVVKPFDPDRSALVLADGTTLGIVGEFKSEVRQQLKLPIGCAGFEVGIQELLKARSKRIVYKPLSRFPSISQDICLEVGTELSYGALVKHLKESLSRKVGENESQAYTLQPIDIYESGKLQDKKRITYRVTLTDYERTLTEEVLTGILSQVASDLEKSVKAKRI